MERSRVRRGFNSPQLHQDPKLQTDRLGRFCSAQLSKEVVQRLLPFCVRHWTLTFWLGQERPSTKRRNWIGSIPAGCREASARTFYSLFLGHMENSCDFSSAEVRELREALRADIGPAAITLTDDEIRQMAAHNLNLLRVFTRIVVAQHERGLPWPHEINASEGN